MRCFLEESRCSLLERDKKETSHINIVVAGVPDLGSVQRRAAAARGAEKGAEHPAETT